MRALVSSQICCLLLYWCLVRVDASDHIGVWSGLMLVILLMSGQR